MEWVLNLRATAAGNLPERRHATAAVKYLEMKDLENLANIHDIPFLPADFIRCVRSAPSEIYSMKIGMRILVRNASSEPFAENRELTSRRFRGCTGIFRTKSSVALRCQCAKLKTDCGGVR